MREFIEALHILAPYYEKGLDTKYFCEAEHDIIFTHVSSEQLPEDSDDGVKLIELGFHVDESIDVWAYYT